MRFTTFHTSNNDCEDPAFPPVMLCLRVLTNQQHNRPHSVLDRACQTLWPVQIDDGLERQFIYLGPATLKFYH